MAFLTSATLDRLRDDFDAREETLEASGRRPAGRTARAARARPRRRDLLLRLPLGHARARGRGDQLSRHQRDQEPARGLAAGAMLGAAGGRRCVRRVRADRAAARRVSAQDDAAPRRARSPRRDLLHTIAGAVIFDMYENQDARLISIQIPDDVLAGFPGPGLRADQHPQEDRALPSTSPRSARSSSRRPGSRPTTSSGWSARWPAARS